MPIFKRLLRPGFQYGRYPDRKFSVPPPMSDADVQSLIANINSVVAGQQAAAIAALTAQIQTANAATLTPDQISALVKKATDDLVAQTIKNATSAELAMLITRAGFPLDSRNYNKCLDLLGVYLNGRKSDDAIF